MSLITDKHRIFCREMVALARKHGANNLKVEFDFDSYETRTTVGRPKIALSEKWSYATSFFWSEAMKGGASSIIIDSNEHLVISEEAIK